MSRDGMQRRHAPQVAGLIAFTLTFYWRVTTSLGTNKWPSNLQDGASFAWNLWYFSKQVTHFHDPFVTHDLFFPIGAPLGFHTYTPLLGLIAWPFIKLFGLTNTYTLFTLLGPTLAAIGTYFLALHITKNRWAAFYAGCAYAALPDQAYRMVGHLNLNQTWVLPFALLALIRFYETPRRRTIIELGTALGVSLWVDAIFTSFVVIATLVFVLCKFRTTLRKPMIINWLKVGAIAIVTASPILFAMFRDIKNNQLDPLPGWGEANHTNADVFSYVIPSQFNPITGSWFAGAQIKYTVGERFAFLGWSVLALALVSLFLWKSPWKKTISVMALVFFVLSLGPFLLFLGAQGHHFTYLGERFNVPLPYFLLHFIPIINGVRIPARFEFMTNLLFIVMAAAALTALMQRKPKWTPAFAIVAIALMTLESLPGNVPPLHSTKIPTPYTAINNDSGNGAVLELPIQWRDGFGQIGDITTRNDHTIHLYYATRHGKPLVNGMIARYPDKSETALQQIPVYSQILTLQHDQDPQPITFGLADLQKLGIGYVVGHRDESPPDAYTYMNNLHMSVLADDGNTIVWKVD
jgi:hypothetical protein